MEGYMTLKEAAEKWGIGDRRINTLCLEGRIEGASKIGNLWVIPVDTPKPDDNRIKPGKYIKKKACKEQILADLLFLCFFSFISL